MRLGPKTKTALTGTLLFAGCLLSAATAFAAEWRVDVVDQSGPGRYTSLKIDADGNAHLAYIPEVDGHPLKYAYWDHKLDRWFTMTVAANASFCTLVLDSKQRPHISYADFGTGKGAKLRYAHWNGTAWEFELVSPRTEATVGYYTSIGLNAADKPFFSYYDYLGPDGGQALRLRSVYWGGKYWGVQVVDPVPGSGKFNSLAVDSKGLPHIAYANVKAETMGLRYASWNGDAWTTEILEGAAGPYPIFSVALVLDKNDNPHIAYTDLAKRVVKYATRQAGQWRLYEIDALKKWAYPDRNGIALDAHGNVYISYYDELAGVLKVASMKDGKWYGETVARDYAGFTSSLQVHDDTLWLSFADDGSGSVKVAHRSLQDQAAPSAAGQAPATSPEVSRGRPATAGNRKGSFSH